MLSRYQNIIYRVKLKRTKLDLVDEEKISIIDLKTKINDIINSFDFCSMVNLENKDIKNIKKIPVYQYLLFFVSAKTGYFVEESFTTFIKKNLNDLFYKKKKL